MTAMPIEARIVGVSLDAVAVDLDRLSVVAQVGGAPTVPDDRVDVRRVGLVFRARLGQLSLTIGQDLRRQLGRAEGIPEQRDSLGPGRQR